MNCGLGSSRGRARREGVSEAIGFVLILAAVMISLTVYLLYMMPAMGRENEIAQMSAVKDSLTEYKLNIDTLWTSRQCTTDFGPALTLGSGETGGILGFFPFLRPAKAGAILALNQRAENITITSDSFFPVSSSGYTDTRTITTTPFGLNVNITPQHLFIDISSADLFPQRGILVDGPGWDVWVNISPQYSYTQRFNITTFPPGSPEEGGIASMTEWYEYVWNSSDITVSTFTGSTPIVNNLAVYRGISASAVYRVDLMNPVYGISSQFQTPQNLLISKSDAMVSGTYYVNYGFSPSVTSITMPLGSIEYRSNNIYYTPQTYYYQLGGVFLEQADGSTNEIPPSISFSMVNSSPVVRIGEILLQGSVLDADVSGSGPITITSAVTDIKNTALPAGNNTRWVNLTIQATTANASAMWLHTLRDLADRGGLPATSYTNGSAGNTAFINVTGNPQVYDVQLALAQVNVSADYVEEYTSGGISRSWRSVPGYAAPGFTTTTSGLNATTTTLGSSTGDSFYGEAVTFTATVTPSGGPGTPTGTVTFYNESGALGTVTLISGTAVFSTSTQPVGVHTITAIYDGDSYYETSTSNAVQLTVSLSTPPAGYVPWRDCSWTHRKNITIINTKVVGSLTDFPVLINLTLDSDLKANALANGQDILFTKDDGTTKLPHQVEYYNSAYGGLVAWVKVDSLSSGANTSIYMYYGNPAATPQWQNTSVWSNGYVGVWHLAEIGTILKKTYEDSSGNGNNGLGGFGVNPGFVPTRTAGKIGFGQNFASVMAQVIKVDDSASLQITGPLTLEGWTYGTSWSSGNYSVIDRMLAPTGNNPDSYYLSHYQTGPTSNIASYVTTGGTRNGNPASDTWVHYAMNFTGSGGPGTLYVFQNGVQVDSLAGQTITIAGNPVLLGAHGNPAGWNRGWEGNLDELRISNVARTGQWLTTQYNNQNSPTNSFYSVGPQESSSCAPAFVQGQDQMTTGSSVTLTLPGMSTPGNLMVVSVLCGGSTVSSVTDSKGNAYTLAVGPTNSPGWANAYTYYAPNINGGGSPITVTINLAASVPNVFFAAEYSGVSPTNPLDQTAGAYGASGPVLNSGSATTTQNSELIFGFLVSKPGQAFPGGTFTQRQENDGHIIMDKTVSSTGSYSADGTQAPAGEWLAQMVTFKGK